MGRLTSACAILATGLAIAPSLVHAGGREFPGDGTRAMGRGGAGMTRPDTPRVMTRNPALLSDLPGSILELNQAVTVPDACFQPSGGYGLDVAQRTEAQDVVMLPGEDEPLILGNADTPGGYYGEAYPEVCYSGGYVFLPSVMLGGKMSDDLGWSLGFIPPDLAQLSQWGDRDGTIQTPNGRRPNPTRYTGVHQNATFFSLQGALGYKLAPWLSIGAGVRWSMVVFQGATMATALENSRKASDDGYGELRGRDLFIPGFNVSLHAVPADNLDVAIGFRWEDALRVTNPKLDVITNVWGVGRPVEYEDGNGTTQITGAGIPVATNDLNGTFEAPPLIVPQLSFSLRYADRIVTRAAHAQARDESKVGDAMDTERWDVELDAVYYMSSLIDQQVFTFKPGEGAIRRLDVNADGSQSVLEATAGKCLAMQVGSGCPIARQNIRPFGGRDQWTFRLGSDVNILPGRFAVRAGVSYEQRGVDPNQVFNNNSANLQRTGLHAGFTLRFGRTDFSVSYVHFMTETLEINFSRAERDPRWDDTAEGPGDPPSIYHPIREGDAAAFAEVPDNDNRFGSSSVNAGRYTQSMDVVAIGLAQHF